MDINQLIKQAEQQQRQLQLAMQFQRNLAFFNDASPEITAAFSQYVPNRYGLEYCQVNGGGHWDLKDLQTGQWLYRQDPVAYAERSVDRYRREPFSYFIEMFANRGLDTDREAHLGNINYIAEEIDELVAQHPMTSKAPLPQDTPFLMVNGIGLGYHLPALIDSSCIHHLAIVEPEADMFFASLHTIDWERLCNEFSAPGRSLNLVLAQEPNAAADQLIRHVIDVGLFNCSKSFVFSHLNNDALTNTRSDFFTLLSGKVNGLGYFDDERLGLAHTVANFHKRLPVLDFSKKIDQKNPPPVFVVANGPSLDQAAAMLAANKQSAFIISCGTSLGSLYKLGIKPDIHVEMERTRPVVEWLDAGSDAEFRKGVSLVALNTVHPDVFSRFESSRMVLKANDLGAHYMAERLSLPFTRSVLSRCNPTVGNMGLSLAITLGFKEIYLVGLDLGFPESGQHHSTFSAHYALRDEEVSSLNLKTAESRGNKRFPGNFGGEVIATTVFATARTQAQLLLRENPNVRCFNTSGGVLIEGATPLPCDQVSIPKRVLAKAPYLDRHAWHKITYDEGGLPSSATVSDQCQPARQALIKLGQFAAASVVDTAEAWELLQSSHNLVKQLSNKAETRSAHWLIKGSVETFMLILANCLYAVEDEQRNVKLFNRSLSHYRRFISQAEQQLGADILRLDNRSRGLKDKLKVANR